MTTRTIGASRLGLKDVSLGADLPTFEIGPGEFLPFPLGDLHIWHSPPSTDMQNASSSSKPTSPEEDESESVDDSEARPRTGRGARPPRKRLSEILTEIAADESRSDISVSDLMRLMEGRARAALIFIFAFPNVLPAPPGLSALLGLPLLYLTTQMMLGHIPWLPKVIGARGVPRANFAATIDRIMPLLRRAERMLKPRWTPLVSHGAEKPLGALALMLAIVVTLPIPLGNMLPAFAICLIALGVLERDGFWAGLGIIVGVGALALSATVVYTMMKAALFILLGAFS